MRIEIGGIATSELKSLPSKTSFHSDEAERLLMESVKSLGVITPLVVHKPSNTIIDGHRRWQAAKLLDIKLLNVVFLDVNERFIQPLHLTLNGLKHEFDWEKTAIVLNYINDTHPDLMKFVGLPANVIKPLTSSEFKVDDEVQQFNTDLGL